MKTSWFLAIALGWMTVGCGGSYPAERTTQPTAKADSAPSGGEKSDKGMDITKAALPFKVLRADGGQEVSPDEFFSELALASAVCLGESHPNPHHHWAQLHMLDKVSQRRGNRDMAVGMEMFQRPFQGVLDDYAAGRIDEGDMLTRTGWAKRWGYDFSLYRPMVAMSVERGIKLIALNIEQGLRKKFSRKGIDGLTERERAKIPELDLNDVDHRTWFHDLMAELGGAHGHAHGHSKGGKVDEAEAKKRAERIYTTQVLWDETMAETAARWLADGSGRQVVIIAGSGHCHTTAIVNRLRRRGVKTALSVRPVIDDGEGSVANELARPITDYLFVMTLPK